MGKVFIGMSVKTPLTQHQTMNFQRDVQLEMSGKRMKNMSHTYIYRSINVEEKGITVAQILDTQYVKILILA